MHSFITSAGGIASAITAIIGLLTLVLWKPIKKLFDKKKKRHEEDAAFRTSMLKFADDSNKRMKTIEDAIDANEKDRIRREMFTFAAECRRGELHTLDEFRHVITIKDKYETLLKKTGDKNGVFDAEYEYIMEVYSERQRKNDFLT